MSESYGYYKAARDMSWRVLIECGIKSLPVDLNVIARHYGIDVILYSNCTPKQLSKFDIASDDGFITKVNGVKTIYLNDKKETYGRRRFTVGHELGHGILGHPLDKIIARNSEIDSRTNPLEMQANVFSRDTLAPACVLNAIGVTTVSEIMAICKVSKILAEIRLERLNELRARGKFFTSPLETRVYRQFTNFIENYTFKKWVIINVHLSIYENEY